MSHNKHDPLSKALLNWNVFLYVPLLGSYPIYTLIISNWNQTVLLRLCQSFHFPMIAHACAFCNQPKPNHFCFCPFLLLLISNFIQLVNGLNSLRFFFFFSWTLLLFRSDTIFSLFSSPQLSFSLFFQQSIIYTFNPISHFHRTFILP